MAKPRRALTPKERIDRSAYDLFTRHGIRAVGVDTIVARSRVGKMTLYRHYASKDALALAFLDRRWLTFSRGWQATLEELHLPPRQALLAVFDVLDKWYRSPAYSGCPVVKAVLESAEGDDPVYAGALRYFAAVRSFLRRLAQQAGVRDADAVAMQWHILVWGSIIAARAQERDAAKHAKALAAAILSRTTTRSRKRSARRARLTG